MRAALARATLGAISALAWSACSFDRAGLPTGAGAADAATADAMADADPPDAAPDAAPDADPCPGGYASITGAPGSSRYRLVTSGAAWLAAEHACEADGPSSHLAILTSDGERDAVRGAISGDAWLGVTDIVKEGTFALVTTGQASYLPWNFGEPNDLFGEDCVELNGGGFNDEDCGATNVYVCECDGTAADPVAYTAP
jgi:hypothetical protein